MSKLSLDALTVESFATADSLPVDQPAAGITAGFECNRTLDYSCTACDCQTPRYNCV
jgi:hypothetical protein